MFHGSMLKHNIKIFVIILDAYVASIWSCLLRIQLACTMRLFILFFVFIFQMTKLRFWQNDRNVHCGAHVFSFIFQIAKKCKHEDSVYGMCNKYSLNSELHFLFFIIKVCNEHEAYMTLIYCSNLFFPVTNVCNKWICRENMAVEVCAKVNYICGIWHKA